MKPILLVAIAALTALPNAAFAKTACYAPKQVMAEELLRLHSELMVITVTCRQGSEGNDLSPAYTSFTKKNIHALHDAEQTMISYYKATGNGDPVENLDRLRTRLGNEFGQKVAAVSAPAFCNKYRDDVAFFASATAAEIDKQVKRMESSERPYVKTCGAKW